MKIIYLFIIFCILSKIQNTIILATSSVDCETKSLDIQTIASVSCSKPYIIIPENYYSFSKLKTSPPIAPLISTENKVIFYLDSGVDYEITFQVKSCPNIESQSINIGGFYYHYQSLPKCLYSTTLVAFYNGSQFNSISGMGAGMNTITDGQGCSVKIFLPPTTTVVPSISSVDPICGFDNGTITVQNINTYTSAVLFDSDNTQYQNTLGVFTELKAGDYKLYLSSNICGEEIVPITLRDIMPQLIIDYHEITEIGFNTSRMSFSFSDSNFNSSMVGITYNGVEVTDWSNFIVTIQSYNSFSYYYNSSKVEGKQCKSSQSLFIETIFPNVAWTLTPPSSDLCTDNVTIKMDTNQTVLIPDNIILNSDNSFTVPWNGKYEISSKQTFTPGQIPTYYEVPVFNITRGSLTGSCSSTFDLQILNIDRFSVIYVEGLGRTGSFKPQLIGDTFVNCTVVYNIKIAFVPIGCDEDQVLYHFLSTQVTGFDLDLMSVEYDVIQPSTCQSPEETFNYTVITPLGNFGPYTAVTVNQKYQMRVLQFQLHGVLLI